VPPISALKRRRQELNMTQAAVAKAAGISQPTYQNYEAGTLAIPPTNIKKLAKALKMTKEEILGKSKAASPPWITPADRVMPPINDDAAFFGAINFDLEIKLMGRTIKRVARLVYEHSPEWEHYHLGTQSLTPSRGSWG
jgi:transcriptional regulator with XRE-family HTH domain